MRQQWCTKCPNVQNNHHNKDLERAISILWEAKTIYRKQTGFLTLLRDPNISPGRMRRLKESQDLLLHKGSKKAGEGGRFPIFLQEKPLDVGNRLSWGSVPPWKNKNSLLGCRPWPKIILLRAAATLREFCMLGQAFSTSYLGAKDWIRV